jgi:hypothetical protein
MAKKKTAQGQRARAAKTGRSKTTSKPRARTVAKKRTTSRSAKPVSKKRTAAKPKARTVRATALATPAGVWPGLPPGWFDRAR